MRKFLSLVLALVMMMSLVTINAGAKEFTDADDITYVEAVDVISTIKVMDGYEGGGFNPAGNLTRGAAAKIICNLILGPTTAAELHADTAPYRDVPVNHTFAGYIAYCQKEGIVSGYADGSFRPAGTLTGYAFMKMLLGALGYDAEIEGYVGPNWSINVAKKAISLGLNNSLVDTFNGVDYITREEAALYAFNTLQADLVEYDTKITATVNGAEVTVGNSTATSRKWNSQQTRYDSIRKDSIVQFAEEYFNKLVLTKDMDVFGRPDREWKYDGDMIGSYINYDLFKQEYTAKVTGRDLYDLLGSSVVDLKDGYDFEIRVDGIETVSANKTDLGSAYFTQANLIRSNTEKIGETGNGVLTQVFVDNDKDVEKVWIAVINTYLAKATADYNEKKDEADFEVWSLDNKNTPNDKVLVKDAASVSNKTEKEVLTVSGEDFDIEDVKENDIVLVRVADGEIQEFLDPEVIDNAEITSFKKNNWVKADEQYDYATTAMYDDEVLDDYDQTNMKDTTYRIFLDPYGYAIGVEIIEDTAKYVFLTGIDGNTSNLKNKTADGNIIHTDGTMETVKINMAKSRALNTNFVVGSSDTSKGPYVEFIPAALWNTWCTYTVSSDGVYTLTQVANTDAQMGADDKGASRTGTKRTTDKVGQGWNVTKLGVPDDDYTAIIDKKHISLDGLNGPDGSLTSAAYRKVYGNDDSVYINVSVDMVRNATQANPYNAALSDPHTVVIDDVDSVSTGVQTVSLKAYDWKKVQSLSPKYSTDVPDNVGYYAYGAYTLFDDDGFVIAAVVVGEDEGVSSKYAYAYNNDVDKETWTKDTSKWTWTKDVIIDGEKVTLEEIGDGLSELDTMVRNNWYEVKFKADETVKEVTLIGTSDDVNHNSYMFCKDPTAVNHPTGSAGGSSVKYPKYVGLIELVEKAQEDNTSGKVILFEDMWSVSGNGQDDNHKGNALTYTLNTAGTSLQVQNATTGKVRGFAVSSTAKTVLVQDKRVINKDGEPISLMDSIEYFDGGKTGLERAVKKLNLNNKKTDEWFRGYVSAVFENGVAQTVIIYEKLPNDVNWGGSGGGAEEGQLPNYSEVPVSVSVSGASSSIGRYADGKLYLQFNNLPANVTEMTVSGLTVTEAPSGMTRYLENVTFTKAADRTFYVWSTSLDMRDETNSLSVSGAAATTEWAVDYSDAPDVVGPEKVKDSATTFDVVLNKPTGATEWTYTYTDVAGNITAANVMNGTTVGAAVSSGTTNTTTDASVTLRLTRTAGVRPAPDIAIAATKYALTMSASGATYSLANKVAAVTAATTPVEVAKAGETIAIGTVVLSEAPTGTTNDIVVKYTINNGSVQTMTIPTVGSQVTYTISGVATGAVTGATTINITSVEVKAPVTVADVAKGAYAVAADVVVKAYDGETEVVDGTKVAVGTTLRVTATATATGDGVDVTFGGGEACVITDTSKATTVEGTSVVALDGTAVAPTVANK